MVYNPFILRSGISQSVPFSIIELGVVPKCFVKQRVKYLGSLNPTSYAISDIFILCVTLFLRNKFPLCSTGSCA